jgi:lipopolysaccharide transport system ATP-binding protein
MSSELVIQCAGLAKAYQLYPSYNDRLLQLFFGSVHRFYKEYWALSDFDLEVKRGECLGIIGSNGSGKTTLLQLLCGITKPTRGELSVTGRLAPILGLGSGFLGHTTGRENVLLGGALLGLRRTDVLRRMDSIVEFSGVGSFIDQPLRLYSAGMRSRLAFAICAHADADILVVDEALAVGDSGFRQKCLQYMESFLERGTLLFVSHDMQEIEKFCHKVIWIDQGRIRAHGRAADVIQLYNEKQADDGALRLFDRKIEGEALALGV